MNYTYQSFNFRNRQGARPFYDLVASIAAEEFGHIELVSTAINTMLTGAAGGEPGELGDLGSVKGVRNTQQFIAGGGGHDGAGLDGQAVERGLCVCLG
jgi:manganese catalase